MSNAPLFAPRTVHDPKHGRRVIQSVKCRHCGEVHEFRVNTRSGGMADETIMRKARLLGWEFRRKGREVTCGDCIRSGKVALAVHKLDSEPEAMESALTVPAGKSLDFVKDSLRLEAVLDSGYPSLAALREKMVETGAAETFDKISLSERLMEEPKPMTTAAPKSAPRSPSREDKRKVLDKLNEVYAGEETGYAGDWTDAKVAASLSVPPAWVRDLRIEFHGENAGNESTDKEAKERRRAINELRSDMDRVERVLLTALADAEKAIGGIKARLAKLDGEAA